jgi:hypothetical protein
MDYYVDTEFYERGRVAPIELLSIALVSGDGREYYAQVLDAVTPTRDSWVAQNVLPHFDNVRRTVDGDFVPNCHPHASQHPDCVWKTATRIALDLRAFCNPEVYGKPRFIGYYMDYDWVVLCQLFGSMVDLPQGWPMLGFDLRQYLDMRGLWQVKQPDDAIHHALFDARWVAETFRQWDAASSATLSGVV